MAAFNVGAIVKHKSGDIKGVVDSVTEQDSRPTWYRVQWDSGDYSSHAENELRAATGSGPQTFKLSTSYQKVMLSLFEPIKVS